MTAKPPACQPTPRTAEAMPRSASQGSFHRHAEGPDQRRGRSASEAPPNRCQPSPAKIVACCLHRRPTPNPVLARRGVARDFPSDRLTPPTPVGQLRRHMMQPQSAPPPGSESNTNPRQPAGRRAACAVNVLSVAHPSNIVSDQLIRLPPQPSATIRFYRPSRYGPRTMPVPRR